MTYNSTPRRPLTKKQRPLFLAAHDGRCYFCGHPITDDLWDDEHVIARELGGTDDMDNRKPIHRSPCHKIKTAADRKLIAKSNRIRRRNGPVEDRRKPKVRLKGRSFSPSRQKMQSRPFPKRGTTP